MFNLNLLILASSSPRRKELLSSIGIPFTVIEPTGDESYESNKKPEYIAQVLAQNKAVAVGKNKRHGMILAADTIVTMDNQIMGKPKTKIEARAMLQQLKGKIHTVITGLAWIDIESGFSRTEFHKTVVQMREYTDHEVLRFIATGSPFDKAGGYAIQDAHFNPARKIIGCYTNVVGLPLCDVLKFLSKSTSLRTAPHMLKLWASDNTTLETPLNSSCKGCETLIKRNAIQK